MICKNNNKCKIFLKVFVSSFLVVLLIINVDWMEVWSYISGVDVFYILAFILFYILGIFISARKWQALAQFKKFTNGYIFYVKTYLLGTFLNNFFPSFVGGDAYRIYSLGKPVDKLGESSVTVVIDRISGLMGVIVLAIIFALYNFKTLINHEIIIWIIGGLIIAVISFVFILIFFKYKFIRYSLNLLPAFIQKYIDQLADYRSIEIMVKSFLYTFLFAFIGIVIANYLLFKSIGVCLSVDDFISVIFLSSIIAAAPISVGNIGVKEWAYVFLFGIFGVSASAAVSVVVLSRVLQMFVSLLAIPFYWQNKDALKNTK